MRILTPCILLAAVSLTHAAHVQFNLSDFTADTSALKNRYVHLIPQSTPGVEGSSIIMSDRRTFRTDINASFVASNVVQGTYSVQVVGPFMTTIFSLTLPDTNVLVNAKDYISVSTNAPNAIHAYSIAASDLRYVRHTSGAIVAPTNIITRNVIPDGVGITATTNADNSITLSLAGGGGGGIGLKMDELDGVGTNTTIYVAFTLPHLTGDRFAYLNGASQLTNAPFNWTDYTNGFVDITVTNGLASIAYVNAATNGFVGITITNGLASIAALNNASNVLQALADAKIAEQNGVGTNTTFYGLIGVNTNTPQAAWHVFGTGLIVADNANAFRVLQASTGNEMFNINSSSGNISLNTGGGEAQIGGGSGGRLSVRSLSAGKAAAVFYGMSGQTADLLNVGLNTSLAGDAFVVRSNGWTGVRTNSPKAEHHVHGHAIIASNLTAAAVIIPGGDVQTQIDAKASTAYVDQAATNGVQVAAGSNITVDTDVVAGRMVFTVHGAAEAGPGESGPLTVQTNTAVVGAETNLTFVPGYGIASIRGTNFSGTNVIGIHAEVALADLVDATNKIYEYVSASWTNIPGTVIDWNEPGHYAVVTGTTAFTFTNVHDGVLGPAVVLSPVGSQAATFPTSGADAVTWITSPPGVLDRVREYRFRRIDGTVYGSFIDSSANASVVTFERVTVNSNLLRQTYSFTASSSVTNFILDFGRGSFWSDGDATPSVINFVGSTNRTPGYETRTFVTFETGLSNVLVYPHSKWSATNAAPLLYPSNKVVKLAASAETLGTENHVRLWTEAVMDPVKPDLMLDKVTGNYFGAYSTRKLDKDYTGYSMRIREMTGNTTLDVGFTYGGHLDTNAIVAFCAAAGATAAAVTNWYDQSGNGNHLTQVTTTRQPLIYSNSVFNVTSTGRIGVKFHANGMLTNLNAALDQPVTVYWVGQATEFVDQKVLYGGATTLTSDLYMNGTGGNISMSAGAFGTGSKTLTANVAALLTAKFNTTASAYRLNNGSHTVGNAGAGDPNGLHVGGLGTQFSKTVISEVIVRSIAETNDGAEQTSITADINAYYSIW